MSEPTQLTPEVRLWRSVFITVDNWRSVHRHGGAVDRCGRASRGGVVAEILSVVSFWSQKWS